MQRGYDTWDPSEGADKRSWGLNLLKVPSLVSFLWILTTSWSFLPQAVNVYQTRALMCGTRALMDPRGETLEVLDWERSWCRGDTLGGGGL